MSKAYSYLLNSHLVFLNAIQLKRLLLLCYGICQAKTVNISSIDKEIDSSMSGCKATAQYKWLMMAFQTGNTTPGIHLGIGFVLSGQWAGADFDRPDELGYWSASCEHIEYWYFA